MLGLTILDNLIFLGLNPPPIVTESFDASQLCLNNRNKVCVRIFTDDYS